MINTPRQVINQNAAHSFVSNSGFVDPSTLVSGVHKFTDPVTTVTATVRPTNAISLPTTTPGLSVMAPTCVPLLIPQVPSVIPSLGSVDTKVERLTAATLGAAVAMDKSSAFHAIFPQGPPADSQCVLSFPDPPKEAFGIHSQFTSPNGNSDMMSTDAAAPATDNSTTPVIAHPSSTQPVPPERQSSQPNPSSLPVPLGHPRPITTNPFGDALDVKQNSSILSDNEETEALWCGTCGHVHDLSTAHTYEYSESVDSDLLCRVST